MMFWWFLPNDGKYRYIDWHVCLKNAQNWNVCMYVWSEKACVLSLKSAPTYKLILLFELKCMYFSNCYVCLYVKPCLHDIYRRFWTYIQTYITIAQFMQKLFFEHTSCSFDGKYRWIEMYVWKLVLGKVVTSKCMYRFGARSHDKYRGKVAKPPKYIST